MMFICNSTKVRRCVVYVHAHTVYCMWICVHVISICVCSMYKNVCYVGSSKQANKESTVYRFIWQWKIFGKMLQNSFRVKIFLQITHMDKRKMWHGGTFAFWDKAEKREIRENISPPKTDYIQYIYVIFITRRRVLYEVYKHRARGRGAYKLHIARGGVL